LIDDLGYSYDQPSSGQVNQSNQLLRITDGSIATKGFKYANTRTASSDVDYAYDKNGNLTYDRHKGISEIKYNYLNLPMYIRIDDPQNAFIGGTIEFVYDASGAKLQKIVKDKNSGVPPVVYNYVNGVEYKDNVLQRIAHTEGSVSRQDDGSYIHEYVLRDHLGNARVTFTDANNDGVVGETDIKQINHYYPFGLNMEGNWNGSFPDVKNKYQYNEKQLNTDFGLNWNDYGARFYDPAMARWLAVDPLAEKMRRHSPYNYGFDNPMRMTDPDGREPNDIIYKTTKNKDGSTTVNVTVNYKIINLSHNTTLSVSDIAKGIQDNAQRTFGGESSFFKKGDISSSVKFNVKISINVKEITDIKQIGKNDHVLAIVDAVPNGAKAKVDWVGVASRNGNIAAVEEGSMTGNKGTKLAMHEIGHNLGLGDDYGNPQSVMGALGVGSLQTGAGDRRNMFGPMSQSESGIRRNQNQAIGQGSSKDELINFIKDGNLIVDQNKLK
jgi:RHS repeat-associated protein